MAVQEELHLALGRERDGPEARGDVPILRSKIATVVALVSVVESLQTVDLLVSKSDEVPGTSA